MSRQDSLIASLNPYASMSRSARPADPDSPSTLLLQELSAGGSPSSRDASPRRDQASPTPTPTARSPRHRRSSSSSSEEGPPRSLIYGEDSPPARRSGERTPRSPQRSLDTGLRTQPFALGRASSPGPFQPPSSSTSASGRRSASTSPGPSTMSIYASGLEHTTSSSLRDPSTSPDMPSQSRVVPTFREPPRLASSRVASKRTSPRLSQGQGYLDPSIPSPNAHGKGKGKAKSQGGRKYHSLPARAEDEDDEDNNAEQQNEQASRGRLAGFMGRRGGLKKSGLNDYEKALWKWVNVEDLDGFLQEVYDYYKQKGIYCIALARVLNLLTTFFVIGFSTFLLSCIDYSQLAHSVSGPNSVGRLDDVLVGQCLTRGSFPHVLFVITVAVYYVFRLVEFVLSLPKLIEMYRFYTHLLGVPDADIQTLPWPEIVRLIGEIRQHNAITSLSNGASNALAEMVEGDVQNDPKKLDAHDVANRILRQENYLIALFNKDLLDLRVRFPVPQSLVHYVPTRLLAPPTSPSLPSNSKPSDRKYISFGKNTLTQALEWNLRFCLMGYLFDNRGQVRKEFVKEKRRKDLVDGLRMRFIFMGVLNVIFAPFIVVYLLVYSFFRYFDEYHKNPSAIGSRQYTPYAQWKFREFNELPHLFERRLDRSYPTAKEYIDQFPKERTALIMRFVAFVAGSFAAVLLAASLIDPDLFLHFEITPHRTVLFYLGVFGSILAIARGSIPEENLVFDPDASLREVVRWTHYLPGEWKGKLHSQMVHAEFSNLFALKITIFFNELLAVLLTPFILFFSLPPCAGAIVDFFREFTVHVDGVGYVCSFAVFDFRRHGTVKPDEAAAKSAEEITSPRRGPRGSQREWRSNDNKMEKSFLHFKATHPDWQPSDPSSSIFLDRLVGRHAQQVASPKPSLNAPSRLLSPKGINGNAHGGRGLGLGGLDESKLRERSRSYDRAWAKSSALRGRNGLETMQEGEESSDEDEVGAEGWNKRVNLGESEREGEVEDDEDERDETFLRDVGMMGLLQQVMGR